MSWSVSGSGPVEKVAPQVHADFAKINSSSNLVGHEEHLKDQAAKLVAEAIKLQAPGSTVSVDAHGSVSEPGSSQTYSLSVEIEGTATASQTGAKVGVVTGGVPWAKDSHGNPIDPNDARLRDAKGDLIPAL